MPSSRFAFQFLQHLPYLTHHSRYIQLGIADHEEHANNVFTCIGAIFDFVVPNANLPVPGHVCLDLPEEIWKPWIKNEERRKVIGIIPAPDFLRVLQMSMWVELNPDGEWVPAPERLRIVPVPGGSAPPPQPMGDDEFHWEARQFPTYFHNQRESARLPEARRVSEASRAVDQNDLPPVWIPGPPPPYYDRATGRVNELDDESNATPVETRNSLSEASQFPDAPLTSHANGSVDEVDGRSHVPPATDSNRNSEARDSLAHRFAGQATGRVSAVDRRNNIPPGPNRSLLPEAKPAPQRPASVAGVNIESNASQSMNSHNYSEARQSRNPRPAAGVAATNSRSNASPPPNVNRNIDSGPFQNFAPSYGSFSYPHSVACICPQCFVRMPRPRMNLQPSRGEHSEENILGREIRQTHALAPSGVNSDDGTRDRVMTMPATNSRRVNPGNNELLREADQAVQECENLLRENISFHGTMGNLSSTAPDVRQLLADLGRNYEDLTAVVNYMENNSREIDSVNGRVESSSWMERILNGNLPNFPAAAIQRATESIRAHPGSPAAVPHQARTTLPERIVAAALLHLRESEQSHQTTTPTELGHHETPNANAAIEPFLLFSPTQTQVNQPTPPEPTLSRSQEIVPSVERDLTWRPEDPTNSTIDSNFRERIRERAAEVYSGSMRDWVTNSEYFPEHLARIFHPREPPRTDPLWELVVHDIWAVRRIILEYEFDVYEYSDSDSDSEVEDGWGVYSDDDDDGDYIYDGPRQAEDMTDWRWQNQDPLPLSFLVPPPDYATTMQDSPPSMDEHLFFEIAKYRDLIQVLERGELSLSNMKCLKDTYCKEHECCKLLLTKEFRVGNRQVINWFQGRDPYPASMDQLWKIDDLIARHPRNTERDFVNWQTQTYRTEIACHKYMDAWQNWKELEGEIKKASGALGLCVVYSF